MENKTKSEEKIYLEQVKKDAESTNKAIQNEINFWKGLFSEK